MLYALCLPLLALMLGVSSCEREPDKVDYSEMSREELTEEIQLITQQINDQTLAIEIREQAREKRKIIFDEILKRSNMDPKGISVGYDVQELPDDHIPFAEIDEVPVFPGCEDAADKRACFNEKVQRHIQKHFNYPKEALDQGLEGRVAVMFTISSDGKITNIRNRGPHPVLEAEVRRIIEQIPDMVSPGQHAGEPVNVPFSIPIVFKLD